MCSSGSRSSHSKRSKGDPTRGKCAGQRRAGTATDRCALSYTPQPHTTASHHPHTQTRKTQADRLHGAAALGNPFSSIRHGHTPQRCVDNSSAGAACTACRRNSVPTTAIWGNGCSSSSSSSRSRSSSSCGGRGGWSQSARLHAVGAGGGAHVPNTAEIHCRTSDGCAGKGWQWRQAAAVDAPAKVTVRANDPHHSEAASQSVLPLNEMVSSSWPPCRPLWRCRPPFPVPCGGMHRQPSVGRRKTRIKHRRGVHSGGEAVCALCSAGSTLPRRLAPHMRRPRPIGVQQGGVWTAVAVVRPAAAPWRRQRPAAGPHRRCADATRSAPGALPSSDWRLCAACGAVFGGAYVFQWCGWGHSAGQSVWKGFPVPGRPSNTMHDTGRTAVAACLLRLPCPHDSLLVCVSCVCLLCVCISLFFFPTCVTSTGPRSHQDREAFRSDHRRAVLRQGALSEKLCVFSSETCLHPSHFHPPLCSCSSLWTLTSTSVWLMKSPCCRPSACATRSPAS